ncbi:MAG TPA: hypothetical protein VFE84_13145 [Patescibacteria group bacterium]|nr:hypothetical protein [Patescibacteria group bacterium]
MKRSREVTPARIALLLGILLLITGVYQAAVTVVDNSGHVLTVEVLSDPGDPVVQGLALVDQAPGGGTSTAPIFPTWDPIIDQDPGITLNPHDGQPVIVWSRQIGASFEIAMLRRMSGGWGPIDILTNSATSDIRPRAIVDANERAHVVWYPSGIGGPVYLQSFDIHNGQPLGSPQKPLEPPPTKSLKTGTTDGSCVGGGDDPGLIGGLTTRASEGPCVANPAVAPDHGAVLSCGRPAAYQVSSCYLVVGVYNTSTSTWAQTISNLSWQNMSSTTVRALAQSMADARCN